MKPIVKITIVLVLFFSLPTLVDDVNGSKTYVEIHKQVLEEGYSDDLNAIVLILVISGIIVNVLFFRKHIRKKFNK